MEKILLLTAIILAIIFMAVANLKRVKSDRDLYTRSILFAGILAFPCLVVIPVVFISAPVAFLVAVACVIAMNICYIEVRNFNLRTEGIKHCPFLYLTYYISMVTALVLILLV